MKTIELTEEEVKYLKEAVKKEREKAYRQGDEDRMFALARVADKLK